MIFTLHFKTPDVLDQIEGDIVINDLTEHAFDQGLVDGPINALTDEESDKLGNDILTMKEFARKFVRYDEYLTVEFDTVKGTATVRPVGR